MNRRGALAAAISILCTAGIAPANAAGPSPEISLDIDRCPALPREEVLRLAALELDARIVPLSPSSSSSPSSSPSDQTRVTQIRISCDGPSVQTTVVDPITGKQLTRTMDLPAQGTAVAARTVALGAAELVITSWMELTMSPRAERAPDRRPPSPAGSEELRRAAQDRAERRAGREGGAARVLVLAQAAGPFTGMGIGWGGGLRLGWTFARRWIDHGETSLHPGIALELTETRASADAGAGAGAGAGDSLGSVRASTWSAALRATFTLRRGRTSLDLGAGGRLGLARLSGTPAVATRTRGGTLAGTWAGPVAYAGMGVHAGPVLIEAGVEAGQVLRSVDGLVDGGTPVSIAGRWLAGTLAVGWGQ
jgi:hypothetical protein